MFNLEGLTLIPAWISNDTQNKVWEAITDAFQNVNGYKKVMALHTLLGSSC